MMLPRLSTTFVVLLFLGSGLGLALAPTSLSQADCVPENSQHPVDQGLQALAAQVSTLVEAANEQAGQEIAVVQASSQDLDSDCAPDMHFLRYGTDPGARQSLMLQTDVFFGTDNTPAGLQASENGVVLTSAPRVIQALPNTPGPELITSTADPDTLYTSHSTGGRAEASWVNGVFRVDIYNVSSSALASPSGAPSLVGQDAAPYFYVETDLVGLVDSGQFLGNAVEDGVNPLLSYMQDYAEGLLDAVLAFQSCDGNLAEECAAWLQENATGPSPPTPDITDAQPEPADPTTIPWANRGLWVGWLDESLNLVPAEPLYAAPFDLSQVYLLRFTQSGDLILDRDGDGIGDTAEIVFPQGSSEEDPNYPIPRFTNFLNAASVPADLDGDGVANEGEDPPCVYDFDCVFDFELDPDVAIASLLDAGGDPITGPLFGAVGLVLEYEEDSPDLNIFQINVTMKETATEGAAIVCEFDGYLADPTDPPEADTVTIPIDTTRCPDTTDPRLQETDLLFFEFTFVGATNQTAFDEGEVQEVVAFSEDEYAIRNRPITHAAVVGGNLSHDPDNFPAHFAEQIVVEVTYDDLAGDQPVNMTLRLRHNQTGVVNHITVELNQTQVLANETGLGSSVFRFTMTGLWDAHNNTAANQGIDDRDMYVRVWASDRAGCTSGVEGCMNATQTAAFRLFHNNQISVLAPIENGAGVQPTIDSAVVNETDLDNGTVSVDFRARYSHNDAGQDLLDFTLFYKRANATEDVWQSCAMDAQHYLNAPPDAAPDSIPYMIFGALGMGNPLGAPPYQAVANQRHCEIEGLLYSVVPYQYWFNATESGRILTNASFGTNATPLEIVTYTGPGIGTPNATVGDTAADTIAGRNVTFLVDYREYANLTVENATLYEPTVVVQVIGPGATFDDPTYEFNMTNGTGTQFDGTYNVTVGLDAGVYEYRVVAAVNGTDYSSEANEPLVINPGATVTMTDPLGFAKQNAADNLGTIHQRLTEGLAQAPGLPNFWCPVNRLLNGIIGPMHCVGGELNGECPDDADCDGTSDATETAAGADPNHAWNNPRDLDADAIPDLLETVVDLRLWEINNLGNLSLLEPKSVRVGAAGHTLLNLTETGDTGLVELRLKAAPTDLPETPTQEDYEYAIVIGDAYLDVEIIPAGEGVSGIRVWIRNPWNMSHTYGFVDIDLDAVGTTGPVATVTLLADDIDLGVLNVNATNQTTFQVFTDPPRIEQDGEPLSPPVDDLPVEPPADEDQDNVPDGWEKSVCFLLYSGEDAYGACDEDGDYTPPTLPLP